MKYLYMYIWHIHNFYKTLLLWSKQCYIESKLYCHIVKLVLNDHLRRVVRKPAFCICENKDADQLCGNSEADQGLCFRYTDSAIPLLSKSNISSL